jgi:transcriptional regulator with XRE-family HTH domain
MSTEQESAAKPLGARLREQRELRKVSLEEISRITKISIHLLHAMENDNWDALPGGIFTRNFIRLYASHLGLDSERWVEEYKEQTKKQRVEPVEEDEHLESERKEMPQSWLYFLLIVIILLLVGGYFAITRMSESKEPPQPAGEPVSGVVTQKPPQAETLLQAEQQQGLKLELTETENRTFWFKWWADDQLQTGPDGSSTGQGSTIVMEAREKIELHMNHYRSVDARLNGRKLDWDTVNVQKREYDSGSITYTVVLTLDNLR